MTSYYIRAIIICDDGFQYTYSDAQMTELIEFNKDNINKMKDVFFNSSIEIETYIETDIIRWLFRILEKLTELGFKINNKVNYDDDYGILRMYKE